MQHWNGRLMCVIDTETTGLDPNKRCNIYELAIVPVSYDLLPSTKPEHIPLSILIKPNWHDLQHTGYPPRHKEKIDKAMDIGLDPVKAMELFEAWWEDLKMGFTKWGTQFRILPLGQNYHFDIGFISKWLGGQAIYEQFFDYHYRDTMSAALYLNDQFGIHAQDTPFPKVNLAYLASSLGIDNPHAHTALCDAVTTLSVYREMCMRKGS